MDIMTILEDVTKRFWVLEWNDYKFKFKKEIPTYILLEVRNLPKAEQYPFLAAMLCMDPKMKPAQAKELGLSFDYEFGQRFQEENKDILGKAKALLEKKEPLASEKV